MHVGSVFEEKIESQPEILVGFTVVYVPAEVLSYREDFFCFFFFKHV